MPEARIPEEQPDVRPNMTHTELPEFATAHYRSNSRVPPVGYSGTGDIAQI